jgi:hypothetical protein
MHDAKYCGDMLLSCGFRKDSPVIVHAIAGISPCGQTSRIIWPNDPKCTLAIALSRMPKAKAEGRSIVSVDTEGSATTFDAMRAIAAEARRLDLRVIQVPKALLDHLPGSDAEDCAVLNATAVAGLIRSERCARHKIGQGKCAALIPVTASEPERAAILTRFAAFRSAA